jgi:hypothetical protein
MRQKTTLTPTATETLHKAATTTNTLAVEVIHRQKLSVAGHSQSVSGLVQKAIWPCGMAAMEEGIRERRHTETARGMPPARGPRRTSISGDHAGGRTHQSDRPQSVFLAGQRPAIGRHP